MRPNNKLLIIAVIVLLLINVVLLVFMWKGKSSGHSNQQYGPNSMLETMSRELNMTDSQKKNYQTLRDEHFADIKPFMDSIREIRKGFLKMIQSPTVNDSSINAYSRRVADQQAIIDRMTLDHFRKVRGLFNGDQQKKYDDFVQKIMLRKRDSANKK